MMAELATLKKHKINLSDYDSGLDIESRELLSQCTSEGFCVLEAILFSSLKVPLSKILLSTGLSEETLLPILKSFSRVGLIQIQGTTLVVDKERRKFFEFQVCRFDTECKPNIEFLQGLLRTVPIHLLPVWYSISRSSNNIFGSIVEKYLLSPQIYERYLEEIRALDPLHSQILADLFSSADLRIPITHLKERYSLEGPSLEQVLLELEFRFAAFVCYRPFGNGWQGWLVPFYEWQEHLLLIRATNPRVIKGAEQKVLCPRNTPFSFVRDMGTVLERIRQGPIVLDDSLYRTNLKNWNSEEEKLPQSTTDSSGCFDIIALLGLIETDSFTYLYLQRVLDKLLLLKLVTQQGTSFSSSHGAGDWLALSLENRAISLYRHPLYKISSLSERQLREVEWLMKRILHGNWVFLEEFLSGVGIYKPMSAKADPSEEDRKEQPSIEKQFKTYWLPANYSVEDINLIKTVLFETFFECGMIVFGTYEGRECLSVTPFGRTFFEG